MLGEYIDDFALKDETVDFIVTESIKNKETPFLSVLVPVYNSEEFILQCLNSIEKSCSKISYEIILVDDGSVDSSLELISNFKSSGNIKIISFAKNQGISQARNISISESNGEYITFVDSDDLTICDFSIIEGLIKKEGCPSIISSDFITFTDNHDIEKEDTNIIMSVNSRSNLFQGVNGFAWGKFYKRSIFNDVKFLPGRMWEDIITLPILCNKASEVKQLSLKSIAYRENPTSLSRSKPTEISAEDYVVQLKFLIYLAMKNDLINDYFYFRLMRDAGKFLYQRTKHISKKQQLKNFKELRDNISLCRIDRSIEKLPLTERLIDKAFSKGSFVYWKLACLYQSL
ncbi:glycosyltransferase family 2 protein [Klebsiella pneumoniae]|uniref:glycosyltransferase family 2 protein n=1 Tax=Klebsiella pneumoniae TaxID=573 RepID=UPI003F4A49A0